MTRATFAAGCFWGVEEAFRTLKGVKNTEVGYTGGATKNPSYDEVCSNTTGHAEAVKVTFDLNKMAYSDLLKVFWQIHNPTTPNRQGVDVGSQYRSAIFYHNNEQKKAAERSLKGHQMGLDKPIVTEIAPAGPFYRAEEYHQKYNMKHGIAGCHVVL